MVTGGAGYIGSTVASAVQDAGAEVVLLDDLSTGRRELALGRRLHLGDVGDIAFLDTVFDEHPDVAAVVHCAARSVVPSSVVDPLAYYRSNLGGTLALLEAMHRHGCHRLLFSSSAAIYAPGEDLSVDESSPLAGTSPYGRTKIACEQMIQDACRAGAVQALSLRYFNPVGADPALRTGLQLAEPPQALGRLVRAWRRGGTFTVTGTTWPTRDGTGMRDYVHVWDLALAHVRALELFDDVVTPGGPHLALNLGTGSGTTVRELVQIFEEVAGPVRTTEGPAREGDTAGAWARTSLAERLLGWRAERSVADAVRSSLEWDAVRASVLPEG